MFLLVIGLLAVFAGIGLFLSAIGVFTPERNTVSKSLSAVEAISTAPPQMRRDMDRSFNERVTANVVEWLTNMGRKLTPGGKSDDIRRRLQRAGSPAGWTVDRVLAMKVLGMMVLGGSGLLLSLMAGKVLWAFVLGVGGAVLGYFAPTIVLYHVAEKRTEQIEAGLPDALDLLTVSVEAGMGFDAALGNVARNTDGPLAEEFFRVLQDMQLGAGRMDALRALGQRTDVQDLNSFINSVIQADSFGIPIANVLRVQAKEMRTKRMQRAEELAQKVPVKILFPLIFTLLPALMIVVVGPALIRIASGL